MGGGVWPIVDCFLAVVPAPPGCSSVFVLSFWIQFEVFFFKVWFERNIFRVVLQSHLRAECGVSAMSKYCFGGRFFGLKNFKIKSLFVKKKNWSFAEALVNRFNRRKSVFAESYDPEGDDDEGEKVSSASMSLLLFIFCVIL